MAIPVAGALLPAHGPPLAVLDAVGAGGHPYLGHLQVPLALLAVGRQRRFVASFWKNLSTFSDSKIFLQLFTYFPLALRDHDI